MSQEKYDIFISYSRKDTTIADKICQALDGAGITYFIDRQGIAGGMEFPVVLAENIIYSKLFLYLASKHSYESKFTNNEITFAFNEKPKNTILPYIIDGSQMPLAMRFVFSGINWRNMQEHPIETVLIDDLLNLLGRSRSSQIPKINSIDEPKDKENDRNSILLSLPDDEFVAFEVDEKYGFKLKSTGKEVIPSKYDYAHSFREDLAAVVLNGKCGYIDKTGKEVIPSKYDYAENFSEGLAAVQLNRKYGFIDKAGKVVIPLKYDDAWFFSEGLAKVELNGKSGFIDKTGKEVTPLKYDDAWDFSEGLARVWLNDQWGYIDKTGKEVIPLKYDNAWSFSEGLAMVKLNGKYGFIDKTGKDISLKYDYARPFSEGLARVELNSKWGYINKTGKEVIPLKYDLASEFNNGYAKVELNDEYFKIDKNGNRVI